MKALLSILLAVCALLPAKAYTYDYNFNQTPLSQALVRISKDHPELNISFIYKHLNHYQTSARIRTDKATEALRTVIGQNPVSLIQRDGHFYAEALQEGRFAFGGRAVGTDGEPVGGATVMLLAPRDSTVITYGITDADGRFSIPCDHNSVIAKLTCIGYRPTFRLCNSFDIGTVIMPELPINLQTVGVHAADAAFYSDKSVYRPTQRQKNASQTATDLLARMVIPQLRTQIGSSNISTISGQPVGIYIDGIPATSDQLRMMRMADVRTVEYLDYPADPRFQGKAHVVNFIMVKYEYGGYVKTLGTENFIADNGSAQVNLRFVRRSMTYDLMGYGSYNADNHSGSATTESFRLPIPDGSGTNDFTRTSQTESSSRRSQNYAAAFRALYSSEKGSANNLFSIGLDRTPHNDATGSVRYSPAVAPDGSYSSAAASRARFAAYTGNYFLSLPRGNSFSASLNYKYSRTTQQSLYCETGLTPIANGASDATNQLNAQLNYSKAFGRRNTLSAIARAIYEHNRTAYSGSLDALDRSSTRFGLIGASYRFATDKFTAYAGMGWAWQDSKLNSSEATASFPYMDAEISYVPDRKNYLSLVFHHAVWPPSANDKSDNVIHISPFLWHTGNPALTSHKSYDIGLSYSRVLSSKFRVYTNASAWLTGNRDAYVYTATPEGIIRGIAQPIGSFSHYSWSIGGTANLLDRSLQISALGEWLYVRNGEPYNVHHASWSYFLQAIYYLRAFNFALSYQSARGSDNYNSMSGIWTRNKGNFVIQAGWSNSDWNVRLTAFNLQRWNWRTSRETMRTEAYSIDRTNTGTNMHAIVQLSATYTFGFGKKVNRGNDINRSASASSGILK